MKLLKINPGYFSNDLLVGYYFLIKKDLNEHDLERKIIKGLLKSEIKLRKIILPKEYYLRESDFNEEKIIFSNDLKRIKSPENIQMIWAQHKYSVLARDHSFYKDIGKSLAGKKGLDGYENLLKELSDIILKRPEKGSLLNSVLHMWGYLPKDLKKDISSPDKTNIKEAVKVIAEFSINQGSSYLKDSTALCDFYYWAGFYQDDGLIKLEIPNIFMFF